MKHILLFFFCSFISVQTWSQESIKITPDLELIKISPAAYMHVSWSDLPAYGRSSANGLIFIDGGKAFLLDTPWNDSLTKSLVSYLEDKMKLKVTGFVPNHWHEDCMGGLGYIKNNGIRSYAGSLTVEIAGQKGLPVPDKGFTDSLKIRVQDKYIYCYYFGAAHSKDNIVVWIPSERILFPGCMCKSMNSKDLGNTSDGDLEEYPKTIQKVINRFGDAMIVIPGHGSAGGPELLTHTMGLIK